MSIVRLPLDTSEQAESHVDRLVGDERHLSAYLSLFDELLNSALLTATTASVGNAVARLKAGCSRRLISAYLPPLPSHFPEARILLLQTPGMLPLSRQLGDYYAHLQTLREVTVRDAIEPETLALSITTLADAWAQLSGVALGVIVALHAELIPVLREQASERYELVTDLLARAHAGESPCVDSYGAVRLPIWANRRQGLRNPKDLQAYFIVTESLQRAAVLNVCETGIGVLGLRGITVGSRVTLLLGPGQRISGTAMWVNEARCGIQLDESLPPDSQFLTDLH